MDRGQIIFLSFAAVIVLYQMIKGWRLGFIRQVARFLALAAAYTTAFWGGGTAALFLAPLGYPDFVLQCLGGTVLGFLVFLILSLFSGILFKRTAHQDVGLVWFFYGVSGALMGAVFGLILVLFAADSIRLLGSLEEANPANAAAPKTATAAPAGMAGMPKANSTAITVGTGLTELKRSLENGVSGEVLQTVDPVPKKVYATANKIGRVASDAQAMNRFLAFPGASELTARPEIQALSQDPAILGALRDRNYLSLIKNPRIIKAANDPKIGKLVKSFELEKALDYALSK